MKRDTSDSTDSVSFYKKMSPRSKRSEGTIYEKG